MAIIGIAVSTVMVATSNSFSLAKQAREDLRATQIMAQRLETIRLLKWSQVTNTSYLSLNDFIEYYDPNSTNNGGSITNTGIAYRGQYSLLDFPYASSAPSYKGALKLVRITLTWTNGFLYTNGNKYPYVHTRSMDTLVCSNGLQRYVY